MFFDEGVEKDVCTRLQTQGGFDSNFVSIQKRNWAEVTKPCLSN